jgi:hypothetical protein
VAVVVIGDKPIVTYLAPAMVRQSALDMYQWEKTLPPTAHSALHRNFELYVKQMTPTQKTNVAKYLAANGLKVPPLLADGMGCFDPSSLIGPLIQAAASTGSALFSAQAAKKTSEQDTASSNATAAQIAQIQQNATIAAANIASQGTIQAAQVAAGADESMQQTKSQATVDIMPTVAKWGAIAAGGVVFLVIVAMLARRGRSAPAAPSIAAAPATS